MKKLFITSKLAITCVASFVYLAMFGDVLEPEPSVASAIALGICGLSFGLLLHLRLYSFLRWVLGELKDE
ncbi:hypothetical protein [Actibacterium ureilyticum]|uniref:hypothetical protein n=1 Tax=Actibacterium ureilyticum TaxID=1590614 RepID=UPI000BAAA43E|nr:hypothetical protein [Actibacterium ureilyticum]